MQLDPFASSQRMIEPSILSADFSRLGAEIEQVLTGGGDFLHLDVMDGHFVPNISFGPAIIAATRRATPAFLDAHLMIADPVRYAPAMVKAGAQSLTFHVEAVSDPIDTVKQFRKLGCRVGVSIKPKTDAGAIESILEQVDLVLVMSVEPGFSGQSFMPEVLSKCREIKPKLRADQRLQIDGGINADTIAAADDAGVDWFVVASAIFDRPDRAAAIAELRKRMIGATS